MSYKWKPNKAQKEAYKQKMQERDLLPIIKSSKAIREGCEVEFYSTNKGTIIKGKVINSSYGKDKNQHTFTIDDNGKKLLVKGRNLYPNLLQHIQGDISKKESY